jgi:hypothetical protein
MADELETDTEIALMASEEVTVTPGPPAAEVVEIWTDGGC